MTKNQEKRSPDLIKNYNSRYTYLKKAKSYTMNDDNINAFDYYQRYLTALAQWYNLESIDLLSPDLFNIEKDLGELLMISQVYWELAKFFDRTNNSKNLLEENLEKFTIFSKSFKFQRINAQILKQYIKKNIPHHPHVFEFYYKKIQIESHFCFLATYAYPEDPERLETFRKFKRSSLDNKYGLLLVEFYYAISPWLVEQCQRSPSLHFFLFRCFIKPSLSLLFHLLRWINK